MAKYRVTKTFRDGDTWHKQGEVEDFSADKVKEFSPHNLITPVLDSAVDAKAAPKVETADKKLGSETATQPDGRGRR
jgi:hypothetical protein